MAAVLASPARDTAKFTGEEKVNVGAPMASVLARPASERANGAELPNVVTIDSVAACCVIGPPCAHV